MRFLFDYFEKDAPFVANFGVNAGQDIYSLNKQIGCEAFATVSASNNKKLQKDIDRLSGTEYKRKFVFYYSHHNQWTITGFIENVNVIRFKTISMANL